MVRELETERLFIRRWQVKDASSLFEYAKHKEVGPAAGWKPHESVLESRNIITTLFMPNDSFKIVLKENNKIIGSIGFEPDKYRPGIKSMELGYSLSHDYWGRGLMTEAALRVIEYGFSDLGLDIISIVTTEINRRSQGVIKKCGFVLEGNLRRCYRIYTGEIRNCMVFSMLKEEWLSRKKKSGTFRFQKGSVDNESHTKAP